MLKQWMAAAAMGLSAHAGAQLSSVQPRVNNEEYAGARTSVVLHVPAHGGPALVDTEALVLNCSVVDSAGVALAPPFAATTAILGNPIAYDSFAGNTITVDLSAVPTLATVLANAAVAGLQFEVQTPSGGNNFVSTPFNADEAIDAIYTKDITPPSVVSAYRDAGGTHLFLTFSESMSNGDAANNVNQTVLANVNAFDLQFNTINFFDGTQAVPIGLSSPVFVDPPSNTTVRFNLAATNDAAVGNWIRPAYSNAATTSTNDFSDIVKNKATAVAVRIRVGTPNCPADLNADGVVNSSDLGLLLGAWGGSDPSGDVNADSLVNSTDLGLLLGGWGACP